MVTLLPESEKDRAYLLELFVLELQAINKKEGRVMGTYQILERLESIAIRNGMLECPCCGRKR